MNGKTTRRKSIKRKYVSIKNKSSTSSSNTSVKKATTSKRRLSKVTTVSAKCEKCDGNRTSFEYKKIWEELRKKNQLCDGIIISSDNVRFNIHRIIMATVSPYFRALFTNSINRNEQEIKVAHTTIPSVIFQIILDYAYTGNCQIDETNVFNVLKFADQYEILDIIFKCNQFLIENLSCKNCLQALEFTNQYPCVDLRKSVYRFILRNFTEIYLINEEFYNIPLRQLKCFLLDDYLKVETEETVFEAIKSWISYDPDIRKQYILDLIKCVRLGTLSKQQIEYIAQWTFIQQDTACALYFTDIRAILRKIQETDIYPVSMYITRSRIPNDIIFAVGGWTVGSPTNFIETFDKHVNEWIVLKNTDAIARAYHGLCSFNSKIYLIGGFNGREYFNTVRCYSPANHIWTDCSSMYYSRCYVSVAICMKRIYAIGGFNGTFRLNSVERFDPYKNRWELIPPMQKQRSDASAAELKEKIYVIGGFSGLEVMNSAEVFDPLTNQWTFIPSMISARSGVSLVAFDGALYAIGGFNGYTRLSTIEKFNPDGFEWKMLAEMMTSRSNFGTVVLDQCIYVIGGFNGRTTISYVEYYNPAINLWSGAKSMNLMRSALSACVVSGLSNGKDFSYLSNDSNLIHDQDEIQEIKVFDFSLYPK